ncbi:MAG: hypothetical protein ACMUEM_05375 [Flavobacteriales bacterium AspAUS03]
MENFHEYLEKILPDYDKSRVYGGFDLKKNIPLENLVLH